MASYEVDFQVISQVRDEAANASNVTIALRFRRTDYYYVGWNDLDQERWRLNAENFQGQDTGDIGWNLNYTYNNPLPQNQWREVGRNNFRLPHNEDGSLSINIYGKIYFGVNPGTLEARKTITCTPNNRNVRITQFEKNGYTSGTNVGFNWSTSDNIDAIHLYDGDTKLQEYRVSGKSGTISYTVVPNRNYRFQIRVKKSGTNLWTNSGFIEHTLGYPSITGDFNFNINSPINLYFTGTTPPSSVYLYVNSKDDSNYIAERTNITSFSVSINLTAEQKNKIYQKAGQKDWITMVVVQNLHLNGVETPYQQYSATMRLNVSGTAPTFSNYSYSNTNRNIANIMGSNKALANVACMQVQISTANKAHSSVSTISKYVCTVSGGSNGFSRTVEANESPFSDVLIDLGALPDAGYYNISVYAVDTRGIQSSPVTKQNAFEVLQYHVPLAMEFELNRRGNFEQEVDLHIKCAVAKVGGKNRSFTVAYRKRKTGVESWDFWENITGISNEPDDVTDYIKTINKAPLITLNKSESYDFQFKFKDTFSEVVINPDVAQAIAPLSIFEDGTVAINRVPDFNQTDRAKLQIDGDIMVKRNGSADEVFIAEKLENVDTSIAELKEADSQYSTKLEGKVNLSDIVDDLTSTDSKKPLSANQGRILREKIDNNVIRAETQDLHGRPWGHDMYVRLSKIGTHVVCDIKWTGSVGSQSGTISEITVPYNFRPYDNVFATTLNATGGVPLGCTRIQLGTNGKFSFVTDNTEFLERYVTFSYRTS